MFLEGTGAFWSRCRLTSGKYSPICGLYRRNWQLNLERLVKFNLCVFSSLNFLLTFNLEANFLMLNFNINVPRSWLTDSIWQQVTKWFSNTIKLVPVAVKSIIKISQVSLIKFSEWKQHEFFMLKVKTSFPLSFFANYWTAPRLGPKRMHTNFSWSWSLP